jgi:hypothetical protein
MDVVLAGDNGRGQAGDGRGAGRPPVLVPGGDLPLRDAAGGGGGDGRVNITREVLQLCGTIRGI